MLLLFLALVMPVRASVVATAEISTVTYDATLGHNIPNLTVGVDGQPLNANFLDFYQRTGGLTRWGHPTSEVLEETSNTLTQYYQRGVVDWKPASSGLYMLQRRLAWDFIGGGAAGAPDLGVEGSLTNPHEGTRTGPWGHKVSNWSVDGTWTGIADFVARMGGVDALGFPKSDARRDDHPDAVLAAPGATPGFIRQYFQAAVLEYHPGSVEPVKIGLLGDVLRDLQYANGAWRYVAPFAATDPLQSGPYVVPDGTAGTVAPEPPLTPTATPLPTEDVLRSDRADDLSGHQVHVMYVLPADGMERNRHVDGSLHRSVAAFQAWLAGQTGGPRLRMDTFQGQLDISFFRLGRSDAEIASHGAFVGGEIEAELRAAGRIAPEKLYAVYYGGTSSYACGGAPWPPAVVGRVAAVYLKACPGSRLTDDEDSSGYWEFAMLHELLHGLGVVATCAPHHTLAGHTSDDPRDLMYAGALPWRPEFLDVGHDDYYGHANPNCTDLATSIFLDPPIPNAVLPDGWSG